jgi:dipeptidyl-peptidase-3
VAPDKKVSFVSAQDQEKYKALKGQAFEVQVGVHELLGHGSGKLYHQGTPDAERLVSSKLAHPITGEPITGPFYAPGATWGSTFGKISPTYEECRAECSGLFLCLEPEVLQVFGIEDQKLNTAQEISDVSYINWLLMARAGLTGLEFYTPETKGWRQAHMQARYVILRLLLEAGDGTLLSLNQKVGEDGKPDVEVVLNRDLISTIGRKTVGDFLLKLQVYKSLGDVENGAKFYNSYSEVPEEMAKLREIVMARKEPRKLLIQPHMCKNDDGTVQLKRFPCSLEGMIQSFVARFPAEDAELVALYKADKAAMAD